MYVIKRDVELKYVYKTKISATKIVNHHIIKNVE